MYEKQRLYAIINGRQDIYNVLSNFAPLIRGGSGRMLFLTKSEPSEFRRAFAETMKMEECAVDSMVEFIQFNKNGYTAELLNADKTLYCIKMPNNLYHTIPTALNDVFRFVDGTGCARFIHFFTDDCKIVTNSFDPSVYECFMDIFNEPFVMDSKTNKANFAFKKYSPRFVFMSRNNLSQPVSFAQFEAKEHFIVDRERMTFKFDDKVKRLYITELIFRLHKAGLVRHPSFYPDPVLEQWVERDETLPHTVDAKTLEKEYAEDDRYLRNELKVSLSVENAVDPLIKEMSDAIKGAIGRSGIEEVVGG